MLKNFVFTSESVSEGHPDKVADLISDSILDLILSKDPDAKVAVETFCPTSNEVIVGGEIGSHYNPSDEELKIIVDDVLINIGYDNPKFCFEFSNYTLRNLIKSQAPEINNAVENGISKGAGDQGLMFGYACKDTKELMPMPVYIAHRLLEQLTSLRKQGKFDWAGPDAKSQVTVRYNNNIPVSLEKVVISTQHTESISNDEIINELKEKVATPVIEKYFDLAGIEFLINPSGSFTLGGPAADAGLTGRKIIVDTYGGMCPHGGGAFSGKDATKVDRSGAYICRHIAKSIVANEYADRCTIQLSYAIGISVPLSLYLDLHGTGKISETDLKKKIRENFDLTPKGIIDTLGLKRPIFSKTTNYGHFGREIPELTWESIRKF